MSPGSSTQSNTSSANSTFTLLLFASASSYTNTDSLVLSAPTTLPQLFRDLEKKYPGIGKRVLSSCAVTVNLEYVDFEFDFERIGADNDEGGTGEDGKVVVIQAGDEVGIIPPVSSG